MVTYAESGARETKTKIDWASYEPEEADVHRAAASSRNYDFSRNWRTTSTGRRSSRPGIWPVPIRRSSMTRIVGGIGGGVFFFPMASRCSRASSRGPLAAGKTAWWMLLPAKTR